MILPQPNPPSGLAIFSLPFTDFGAVYRSTVAVDTDAARTVVIDGVAYVVTKQNQTQVYNLRVASQERQLGRPLTEAEKNTIAGAIAVLASAAGAAPLANANNAGGFASPAPIDPNTVQIDGVFYMVTRENVAVLVALRIQQLQRERGAPLTQAERETVASAIARLANDAGPADANPSTSTLAIALEGIKRVGDVTAAALTGDVNPNSIIGRALSLADVVGLAALAWGATKLWK
jgi:hypothetical protein